MFGSHEHCGGRDIMNLVYDLILQDHLTKKGHVTL